MYMYTTCGYLHSCTVNVHILYIQPCTCTGLGAVPDNVIHQPPMTITLPMNYTDESIKEMIIAINTSLQEQLTSQMSVFKGEVKVIIEEVCTCTCTYVL